MDNPVTLLGIPLKNHLGYTKFVLSNRDNVSSDAFVEKIPGKNETPLDLWYHGTNNLYRAAHHILDTTLVFDKINQKRPESQNNVEIAVQLYEEAVGLFNSNLEKLTFDSMSSPLKSPISGNETRMDSWIGTNLMHTIGHISQALRLQGMICQNAKIFNI